MLFSPSLLMIQSSLLQLALCLSVTVLLLADFRSPVQGNLMAAGAGSAANRGSSATGIPLASQTTILALKTDYSSVAALSESPQQHGMTLKVLPSGAAATLSSGTDDNIWIGFRRGSSFPPLPVPFLTPPPGLTPMFTTSALCPTAEPTGLDPLPPRQGGITPAPMNVAHRPFSTIWLCS